MSIIIYLESIQFNPLKPLEICNFAQVNGTLHVVPFTRTSDSRSESGEEGHRAWHSFYTILCYFATSFVVFCLSLYQFRDLQKLRTVSLMGNEGDILYKSNNETKSIISSSPQFFTTSKLYLKLSDPNVFVSTGQKYTQFNSVSYKGK